MISSLRYDCKAAAAVVLAISIAVVHVAFGSPMTTVLHKARIQEAKISADASTKMVHGFVACDPKIALPTDILAPLGVHFVGSKEGMAVRSLFAHPVRDRFAVRLVANDLSNEETSDDGKILVYAARYRLQKSISFGEAKLKEVGQVIDARAHLVRLGVTYTFDKEAGEAIASIETGYGVSLRPKIGASPKRGNVWIELREGGRAATCWRFAN